MNTVKCAILILFGFLLVTCKKESRWDVTLSDQKIDIEYYESYHDFYNDSITLPYLKRRYPIYFQKVNNDSMQQVIDNNFIAIRKDSLNRASYEEAKKHYSNLDEIKSKLDVMFKRVNYHFPELNKFQVYFSIGIYSEYTQPVLFNPDTGDLFIALDLFLSPKFPAYDGLIIPEYYQENNMISERIVPLVAMEIAEQVVAYDPRQQKVLDEMVYNGKKMTIVDALLPNVSDEQKIGYSKEQLDWCKENEPEIWNYFVENDLLFDANSRLIIRFFQPSPYTKFGTESEQESPGRIGVWVGWQICKQYLEHNKELSLLDFCRNLDYQKIYTESGYKP